MARRLPIGFGCTVLGRVALLSLAVACWCGYPSVARGEPPAAASRGFGAWTYAPEQHPDQHGPNRQDDIGAINRGLHAAMSSLAAERPSWAPRLALELQVDAANRPRFDLSAAQPIFETQGHDGRLSVHGRVTHGPGGRTGGNVGLRYQHQFRDQNVTVGVNTGVEDRRRDDYHRRTFGAEFSLAPIEFRASVFDDVPDAELPPGMVDRALDGYDVQARARIPYVPWAWLQANRFWQIGVAGDDETTGDRLSLQVKPFAPLEIETGTLGENEIRSWFAQLRFRIPLGPDSVLD